MLEKINYAVLGYEGDLIEKIRILNYNQLDDLKKTEEEVYNKKLKEIYIDLIKESRLSETEVNKFFEENEILSTSSNNGLNAVIFRNKKTNEIEISVHR